MTGGQGGSKFLVVTELGDLEGRSLMVLAALDTSRVQVMTSPDRGKWDEVLTVP